MENALGEDIAKKEEERISKALTRRNSSATAKSMQRTKSIDDKRREEERKRNEEVLRKKQQEERKNLKVVEAQRENESSKNIQQSNIIDFSNVVPASNIFDNTESAKLEEERLQKSIQRRVSHQYDNISAPTIVPKRSYSIADTSTTYEPKKPVASASVIRSIQEERDREAKWTESKNKEEQEKRLKEEEKRKKIGQQKLEQDRLLEEKRKLEEEQNKTRIENQNRLKQEEATKLQSFIHILKTRSGKTITFEWPHTYDVSSKIYLAGSFTDGKEIPLEREDSHVFKIKINVPNGTHFYRFKVDDVWKHDPKQSTATDLSTGIISNRVIVDGTPDPVQPPAESKEVIKKNALAKLEYETGIQYVTANKAPISVTQPATKVEVQPISIPTAQPVVNVIPISIPPANQSASVIENSEANRLREESESAADQARKNEIEYQAWQAQMKKAEEEYIKKREEFKKLEQQKKAAALEEERKATERKRIEEAAKKQKEEEERKEKKKRKIEKKKTKRRRM